MIVKISRAIFYLLLITTPLGTRYIFSVGQLNGVAVEPGTISLFGTQILVALFVVLVLVGSFFVQRQANNLPPAIRFVFITAAIFWVITLISAEVASDPRGWLLQAWLTLGILLATAIFLLRPPLVNAALALSIGGAIQSCLAIWQFANQTVTANKWLGVAVHLPSSAGTFVVETATSRWLRAYGTLSHPNLLGAYLMLAVIASMALVCAARTRWIQKFSVGWLVAINVCGLMLSFSRGAILALIVGSLVLLVNSFCFQQCKEHRRSLLAAIGITFMTALLIFLPLHQLFVTRLSAQGRLEKISVESRLNQLSDFRSLIKQHWLIGVGPGLMPLAIAKQNPTRSVWSIDYIHNVPLLISTEIGGFGLLAWLVLIVSLFFFLLRRLRSQPDQDTIFVLASFVALLVISLFDHFLWSSWFGQLLFWLVIGLAISLPTKQQPRPA